MGNWWGGEND